MTLSNKKPWIYKVRPISEPCNHVQSVSQPLAIKASQNTNRLCSNSRPHKIDDNWDENGPNLVKQHLVDSSVIFNRHWQPTEP